MLAIFNPKNANKRNGGFEKGVTATAMEGKRFFHTQTAIVLIGLLIGPLLMFDRRCFGQGNVGYEDAQSYIDRGITRDKQGDYDGAIADYTQALMTDSRSAAAYNDRGIARSKKGDYDGALADYDATLQIDPAYAAAYGNRAIARKHKGDIDGAIADFSQEIALNSNSPEAYVGRGELFQSKGDYNGATNDYSKALEIAPPNWDYRQQTETLLRQAQAEKQAQPIRTVAGIPMPTRSGPTINLIGQEVYARTVDSILWVLAQDQTTTSQGSAVAISSSTAVTNCHVVMTGSGDENDPSFRFTTAYPQIEIRTHSGNSGHASIIATHPDIDICLIQSSDVQLQPIAGIAPYSSLSVGERVYTIGNPKNLDFSFADGIISAKRDSARQPRGVTADLIQTSAPISPGSSGGALVNSAGLLIGITESHVEGGSNLGFAIPADLLWRTYPDSATASLTPSLNFPERLQRFLPQVVPTP
jgi:S1-C subfamily serine protease